MGNWRNLPKIEGPLLHKDQNNWSAITGDWIPEHVPLAIDLQGLGKTHALIGGIEAKVLSAPALSAPAATTNLTTTDLWRHYFEACGSSDLIAQGLADTLFDVGHTLATYWVRALWDFLVIVTNNKLCRPATLVDAVPRLLDVKELVRLIRIPLAKHEIAGSNPKAQIFARPMVSAKSHCFAWEVQDMHGETHNIERIYLAEQFVRCLVHR